MWRGVSLRQLAFLLLGPLIVETVWTLLVFWMGYQTTALGYEPRQQNWVVLLPAAGYAASALLAGRWVTPRHATHLLFVMLFAAATIGLTAVYYQNFALFLVIGPLTGFCLGHYYVPFQIRMGHVQPFRTLAWTIAFYNISWGIGGAIGPYIAGLMGQQPRIVFTLTIVILPAIHALLLWLATTAPPPADDHRPTAAFASTSQQRRFGWVGFVAANIMMRGVCFTLIPDLAAKRGWSPAHGGALVFTAYLMIPLGAMLWARLRRQMVRPYLMTGTMLISAAGLAIMPLTSTWLAAMACVIALGVGDSCAVFHTLYYSNADPSPTGKARSISMVETLAGGSSVVGPALLGQLASDNAARPLPWVFGSMALLLVAGYVVLAHRRRISH